MYTAIQSAIAVDFTLYKIKLLLLFMFTIIEFNGSCGEISIYFVLDYCFNYVIIVIGIAHYIVI